MYYVNLAPLCDLLVLVHIFIDRRSTGPGGIWKIWMIIHILCWQDDYNCGTSGSMCQGPPQEPFNEEAFEDRKCRNLCAAQGDNKVKEIVIGTVVGAIFAAAVFGTGAFLFMRRRKKEVLERGPSETTNEDAHINADQEEARKRPSEMWGDPL